MGTGRWEVPGRRGRQRVLAPGSQVVLALITPRCVLALVGEPTLDGCGERRGRWELEDGKSLGEGEGNRCWRQRAR